MTVNKTLQRGKRAAARPEGLGRALKLTLLAAALPVLLGLVVLALLAWIDRELLVTSVARPKALTAIFVGIGVAWLLWMSAIWTTFLRTRPRTLAPRKTVAGVAVVAVVSTLITVPMYVGALRVTQQRDFITTVFHNEHTATAPTYSQRNPWGKRNRVNVLLLGGDGAVHRPGVRTDSVMVASISVKTGSTILFALPRNLQDVPFPEGTPLHDLYPDGFDGAEGGDSDYLLNAVYRNIPAWHPGVNGQSDNEGADAIKQAASGALGIPVDYYVLVNLTGFKQIVDAIGGITVNINQPVPIGGDYALGKEPDSWMPPGPDQRLDGFHALWYSRGRYGSSDYNRMQRQRCALNAIVKEADPVTLFQRYGKLVEAGKKLLRTDIPSRLLPDFVSLALKVKNGRMKSVGFERSDNFDPNDPDFEWVHRKVSRVIWRQERRDAGKRVPYIKPSEDSSDTEEDCQYNPVDGSEQQESTDAAELPRGIGTPELGESEAP